MFWLVIFFTMEFYKGIIVKMTIILQRNYKENDHDHGHFPYNSFVKLSLYNMFLL